MLFPIAAVAFTILYMVEKSMLFYSYRLPPMYDERLSESVLRKLQFAPVFFAFFGYWMASSNQLLSNDDLAAVPLSSGPAYTGHTYFDIVTPDGWSAPAWPMLVLGIFLVIRLIFSAFLSDYLGRKFPSLAIGDVNLPEDIPRFYETLNADDAKWTVREEEHYREYGIKIMLDSTYEEFKKLHSEFEAGKKDPETDMQGVHNYDILANPLYLDDFQYVSPFYDDRSAYIIDDDDNEDNDDAQSDIVKVALNLAYMDEEKAKDFHFSKDKFNDNRKTIFKISRGIRNEMS